MGRNYIDCPEFPSEMNCTLSADSEEELLEAAVQHAVAVHKHEDSPEFRHQLKVVIQRRNIVMERLFCCSVAKTTHDRKRLPAVFL